MTQKKDEIVTVIKGTVLTACNSSAAAKQSLKVATLYPITATE